jgi:hypothetical protein
MIICEKEEKRLKEESGTKKKREREGKMNEINNIQI